MNPARRVAGRIKWVNSSKALKAGDASVLSVQSILARMFIGIIAIHAGTCQCGEAISCSGSLEPDPRMQQGWR